MAGEALLVPVVDDRLAAQQEQLFVGEVHPIQPRLLIRVTAPEPQGDPAHVVVADERGGRVGVGVRVRAVKISFEDWAEGVPRLAGGQALRELLDGGLQREVQECGQAAATGVVQRVPVVGHHLAEDEEVRHPHLGGGLLDGWDELLPEPEVDMPAESRRNPSTPVQRIRSA